MEYNAGEIVELAVRRQEVSITELSRRLQVNRSTLYNWFAKKHLPPDLILQIGRAISYDFYPEFQSGFFGSTLPDQSRIGAGIPKRAPEDLALHWMGKYISLLEEYKELLRKGS